MIEVGARGLSCPEPVILTMNAMKKGGSEPIKVTVSNTVARDNICSLAKKRKRTKSTVVKCDLCLDRAGGPACAAACPTKALRLIDAQFMERARQNKRKAAARASASFASMKLNAALDEGE